MFNISLISVTNIYINSFTYGGGKNMEDLNEEDFDEYIDAKEIIAEIEAMATDDELFDIPLEILPQQMDAYIEEEEEE